MILVSLLFFPTSLSRHLYNAIDFNPPYFASSSLPLLSYSPSCHLLCGWPTSRPIPLLRSPPTSRSVLMSLDHFPIFAERRFQPSETSPYPSHDNLMHTAPSWNYSARSHNNPHHSFPQHSSSSWNPTQYTPWPTPSATLPTSSPSSPPPYAPPNPNYRHAGSSSYHHTNYPVSSPRAIISANQSSLSSCLLPITPGPRPVHNNLPSALKYDNPTWGDGLYTIDDPETAPNSEPPASTSGATSPSARASSVSSSASVSPVKLEPEDSVADCFVMEFSACTPAAQASSSLAPPTEVPLRATQASKAMRKMMGVFRLNPFSMHESSGQATTTWTGEDAGPLEEEPQMFEFQLDVPGCERAASEPVQTQPATSSRSDSDFDDTGSWAEGNELHSHYSTVPHPSWLGNDSSASYTLPALRPYSPHAPHSPSSSSVSSRRTPLDAATSDYSLAYTLPAPSSCATVIDNLPSISTMARRWSNTTNLQAPFVL
ncbi:hypothetical protein PAXRUDRAFT_10965 [Paxillus rubicundulus Ve08.2h10]|uniref:Uncharacterized protein n=1 Tax=Paxillus rubicundulus Ve08.2h10 TaxID=930991 RepID=A0A0D0E9Z6_9AGAM|nr:hypothetical protein PAXRUDRAFT_10965 [Paxillus rubicundulus Ve08.2h10]